VRETHPSTPQTLVKPHFVLFNDSPLDPEAPLASKTWGMSKERMELRWMMRALPAAGTSGRKIGNEATI
jgi:hypothetical protein